MQKLSPYYLVLSSLLLLPVPGLAEILPDPGTLVPYRGQQCAIFDFNVTGRTSGGVVWGTDEYTDDSTLAMAAVHAGVLSAGQTGTVRVQIVLGATSYTGSARNGVTSLNYGSWPYSYSFLQEGDVQPEINAGADQEVEPGAIVQLSGTANGQDLSGYVLTWRQVSGPPVTLSSNGSFDTTFTAPSDVLVNAPEVIVLELSAGGCIRDTVSVTVQVPTNTAPVSDAGPDQTVASAASVTLDGSASLDTDNDQLTYAWTQTSGTSVTLSDASAAQPSFTAPTLAVGDQDTALVFSLTVSDGTVSSIAETVTINVQAPAAVPSNAPTNLVATAGDGEVSLAFTAPTNTGGSPITDYEYQLNGGNWVSAGTTTSPITITGLANGTSYTIALRAVNVAGEGVASQSVSATPITTAAAPTNLVATPGDGEVSLAFTAPTNTGGSPITDYEYQLNGGNWVSAGTTTSPITITGLTNGTSYTIALRAVNAAGSGGASASVSVTMPSPASEFSANEAAIRKVIQDDAVRSLQSTIAANQRMTRDARERFIARQGGENDGTEQSNVPFDVNGSLDVQGTTLSSKGDFFGAKSLGDGTQRLVFGDFDVQHDGDTGSSTATLTGRVAWERMIQDRTLLGYFVGGELAHSTIAGPLSGNQNRVGVTVGGYAVHELAKNTYVDGFLTFGAGRNNLELANDVLALDSDYTTRSVTFGAALSGVIEQPGFEIWPELSFSYGRTWIGEVGFTGAAYGLVDNTLSLDAGSVTLANIVFRPEFRVPLDGLSTADSLQVFTFAPRLICQQIKTTVTEQDCGGGAEIGFTGHFGDNLSTISARISADRLGNKTQSSFQLNLQHRF